MMEVRETKRAGSFGCPIDGGGFAVPENTMPAGMRQSAEHPERTGYGAILHKYMVPALQRAVAAMEDLSGRNGTQSPLRALPQAAKTGFPEGVGTALRRRSEPETETIPGKEPRLSFSGREAGGLTAALKPFLTRESLSPRELTKLLDLLVIRVNPEKKTEPEYRPELDLFGDTAELWLFDAHSDETLRFSWRIEATPETAAKPVPESEPERLLTLRAYLLSCPEDPAGNALLDELEERIRKLTRGRVGRKRRAVC